MSGRERQARFRKRQRRGLVVVPAEVDLHRLLDLLIEAGLLTEGELQDFGRVQAATSILVNSVTRYPYAAELAARFRKRHLRG